MLQLNVNRQNPSLLIAIIANPEIDIREFQESFIDRLAEATARSMLQQGMSNMLAHPVPDNTGIRTLYTQRLAQVIHATRVDIVC